MVKGRDLKFNKKPKLPLILLKIGYVLQWIIILYVLYLVLEIIPTTGAARAQDVLVLSILLLGLIVSVYLIMVYVGVGIAGLFNVSYKNFFIGERNMLLLHIFLPLIFTVIFLKLLGFDGYSSFGLFLNKIGRTGRFLIVLALGIFLILFPKLRNKHIAKK